MSDKKNVNTAREILERDASATLPLMPLFDRLVRDLHKECKSCLECSRGRADAADAIERLAAENAMLRQRTSDKATPKEEVLALIERWQRRTDDPEELALAVARYAERRAMERALTCTCMLCDRDAIRALPSEYDK